MVYSYDKKVATILVLSDSVTRTKSRTLAVTARVCSQMWMWQSISKVQTSVSLMWILEGVAALLACTDDETAHELNPSGRVILVRGHTGECDSAAASR